jgi:hypothetical protein
MRQDVLVRSRLPWLVALPVMAAGSFAAHSLGVVFGSNGEAPEIAEQVAGDRGVLPPLSGLVLAVVLVWTARRLLRCRRGGVGAAPLGGPPRGRPR